MSALRPYVQLMQFGLVGIAGFCTDAAIFLLLTQLGEMAAIPARVLAFIPATVVTWLLNRVLVFRTAGGAGRKRDEYVRHFSVQLVGIATNFSVFLGAVGVGLGKHSAQLVPLALGSLAGMVFNYAGSKRFVFLRPRG